jgi:small subunit ribosomal protein S6
MADRRYETVVLIHPDAGEPGAKEIADRVKKLIEDQGGTVSQVQDWGVRELAFLLAKQRRGFYVLFEYRATPRALLEIERNLKLMDRVLRFTSVRQAENAPPAPPRPAPRRDREESEFEGGGEFDGMGEEVSS